MTRLKPNLSKIVEAILFLIQEAGNRPLTQYEIVKSIFIADIWHLKKFGRPISFDNYVAMQFGPVPSETYNILKPDYRWKDGAPEGWPLWERVQKSDSKVATYLNPKRAPNRRKLSDFDVSELLSALQFVLAQGFAGTRDFTHQNSAYIDAWNARGDKAASAMDYEKLLGNSETELVSEIEHASRHM